MSLSFYVDHRAKRAHRYASVANRTGHTLPSRRCGREETTGRSRFLINRVRDTSPISKNRSVDTYTQVVCFLFLNLFSFYSQVTTSPSVLSSGEGEVNTTSLVVIYVRRQQLRSSKFLNTVRHDGSRREEALASRK